MCLWVNFLPESRHRWGLIAALLKGALRWYGTAQNSRVQNRWAWVVWAAIKVGLFFLLSQPSPNSHMQQDKMGRIEPGLEVSNGGRSAHVKIMLGLGWVGCWAAGLGEETWRNFSPCVRGMMTCDLCPHCWNTRLPTHIEQLEFVVSIIFAEGRLGWLLRAI